MKAIKAERLLSVAAAVLFGSALALYALLRTELLGAPFSVICSPGVIVGVSIAAIPVAAVSFVLTTVCIVRKQPCLRTRAAKLRLAWNLVCFLLILYVLLNGVD